MRLESDDQREWKWRRAGEVKGVEARRSRREEEEGSRAWTGGTVVRTRCRQSIPTAPPWLQRLEKTSGDIGRQDIGGKTSRKVEVFEKRKRKPENANDVHGRERCWSQSFLFLVAVLSVT